MTTLTFSDSEVTKTGFLALMQEHANAGRLAAPHERDIEGEEFHGYVIGCAVVAISRLKGRCFTVDGLCNKPFVASALGVPERLVDLLACVFDYMPYTDKTEWSLRFCAAIPEHADLDPTVDRILARLLREIAIPAMPADNPHLARVLDAVCEALNTHSAVNLCEANAEARKIVQTTVETIAGCVAQAAYYASANLSSEHAGHAAATSLIYAAYAAQYASQSPEDENPELPPFRPYCSLSYSQAASIILEEVGRCSPPVV